MLPAELAELYARDLTRLIQDLRAFPDTASMWRTAPGVTNAAGTLALHLDLVRALVPKVVAALTDAELDAIDPESGVGKPMTTRQWLIHLYSHLSDHHGQINYLRRVVSGHGAVEFAQL